MKDRIILHSDINNFYASVECILRPEYSAVPLAVCGDPAKRHGVILAKNNPAKAFGIKTGESLTEARKKCPDLVCVPPHFDLYMDYSRRVTGIYQRYTDRIEPFGNDECWLDVTGSTNLFGTGAEIADNIRETVKREADGLTVSVGVSFNKAFAKLGSDMKKPDAVTVISRENFRKKVWPLPARELFMVGRKTAEALERVGIGTIGQIAAADEGLLAGMFGINGRRMKALADGRDDDPVRLFTDSREIKSVGHGTTTIADVSTVADAETVIYFLSDMVAGRLRKKGLNAAGVHIDLRDKELNHKTYQKPLPAPSSSADDIALAAIELLRKNWNKSPLRTITVSTFNLSPAGDSGGQLTFFEDGGDGKKERLSGALDKIRGKYGFNSIKRCNLIENHYIADRFDVGDTGYIPFKRQ